MPVELIAIDLDGTLLTRDKRIAPATRRAINVARRRGARIVIATARPPRSTAPFYEELGLDSPVIHYNGALIRDPAGPSDLLHLPLALEDARAAVGVARLVYPEVLVMAEILDCMHTDRCDPDFATETDRMFAPNVVAPIDEWLRGPVTKLMLLGPQDRLSAVGEALGSLDGRLSWLQTEGGLIQVMRAGVDKAHALAWLADRVGVPQCRVAAIGDNANDLGMIRWAAAGVAMAGAPPEVLSAAGYVTPESDGEGVADALKWLMDATNL